MFSTAGSGGRESFRRLVILVFRGLRPPLLLWWLPPAIHRVFRQELADFSRVLLSLWDLSPHEIYSSFRLFHGTYLQDILSALR